MNDVFWPRESTSSRPSGLGGKARGLLELQEAGWAVPAWFAVLPGACEGSIGQPSIFQMRASARNDLTAALRRLCPDKQLLAVRSSAMLEDGLDASFAGQLESFLNVTPHEVEEKIVAIWRSVSSDRAKNYYKTLGGTDTLAIPAVIVQHMVAPEASGIAFSADPVTGQRAVAVVTATFGLGACLANGETDGDTWKVDRTGRIVSRTPAASRVKPVAEDASKPPLNEEQVRVVAGMVREIERHFGRPQDVEWALHKGTFYVLQSRPITTLAALADPDGNLGLWDNSNIIESYSGVTTPLTFSFARRAYRGVYQQFCKLLAVPRSKIAANERTYQHMLGLIRGRVYYNLINWYRVLAMLPGFTFNRRFMEQMMGVKEPLPDAVLQELAAAGWRDRLRDGWRMILMVGVIVAHYWRLSRTVRRFRQRLESALQLPDVPLRAQSAAELAAYFVNLEQKLLTRWDAPLLNDFFTMIFCGVLRRLTESWCNDTAGVLAPALLTTHAKVISAEPARRIELMASMVRGNPGLSNQLREGGLKCIHAALREHPELEKSFAAYLADFGERCLGELKLESVTLRDDPMALYRSVGRLAAESSTARRNVLESRSGGVDAQHRVMRALKKRPIRKYIFEWVHRQAKDRVRDRENLRFERTRLFGRIRQVMVEMGRRLASDGHLNDSADVFYLELDEIFGFLAGTSTLTNLAELAALRRDEFEQFRNGPPPPNRLVTRGSPYHGCQWNGPLKTDAVLSGERRQGIGCSPGIVRGRVRLIKDPRTASLEPGEILVAEHTDPGWVLFFPAAAGLLVERGSLLSHSAIVARELGIPTVVSVEGLMTWLRDGDEVQLDGASGVVQRIPCELLAESTDSARTSETPTGHKAETNEFYARC